MLAAKSRFFTSVITGPQTFQYARQDIARKIMLVEWKIYYYKFLAHKPVNSALSTDSFIASFSKIIESLFVNAKTANTKQLSGAETLPKFRETPGPRLEVRAKHYKALQFSFIHSFIFIWFLIQSIAR